MLWQSSPPDIYGSFGTAALFPAGGSYIYSYLRKYVRVDRLGSHTNVFSDTIDSEYNIKFIYTSKFDNQAVIITTNADQDIRAIIYDNDKHTFSVNKDLDPVSYTNVFAYFNEKGNKLTLAFQNYWTNKNYITGWDLENDQITASTEIENKHFNKNSFSNNGSYVVTFETDTPVVHLRKTDTGDEIFDYSPDDSLSIFCNPVVTNNGEKIYFYYQGYLTELSVETGNIRKLTKTGPPLYMELTHREDKLIMSLNGRFVTYDIATEKFDENQGINPGSFNWYYISLSYDSTLDNLVLNPLAQNEYQSTNDRAPIFFDFKTGRLNFTMPEGNVFRIMDFVYSFDGSLIASRDRFITAVRDAGSGKLQNEFICPHIPAFSLDSKFIFFADANRVFKYNLITEVIDTLLNIDDNLADTYSSPADNLIAVAGDNDIYIIDYTVPEIISRIPSGKSGVVKLRFSSDGRKVGYAVRSNDRIEYDTYYIYDLTSGSVINEVPLLNELGGLISSISEDCNRIAVSNNTVYDLNEKAMYRLNVNDFNADLIDNTTFAALRSYENYGVPFIFSIKIYDYINDVTACIYDNGIMWNSYNYSSFKVSPDGKKIAIENYASGYYFMRKLCDLTGMDDDLTDNAIESIKCSPNPFYDYLEISVYSDGINELSIDLYDLFGSHIGEIYRGVPTKGRYVYRWVAGNIECGFYNCIIRNGGFPVVKKLIKN